MQVIGVLGTDTGVGKTICAAALMRDCLEQGQPTRYLKPIETGIADVHDTASDANVVKHYIRKTVDRQKASLQKESLQPSPLETSLKESSAEQTTIAGWDCRTLLQYPLAASPHLAAEHANTPLSAKRIATLRQECEKSLLDWRAQYKDQGTVIIEGAGGVAVPLSLTAGKTTFKEVSGDLSSASEGTLSKASKGSGKDVGLVTWLDFFLEIADYSKESLKARFDIILVARAGLGTLNHTLLSVWALQAKDIRLSPQKIFLNRGGEAANTYGEPPKNGQNSTEREHARLIERDNVRTLEKFLAIPVEVMP